MEEGGIGLRSLKEFNNSCLSKLAVDFLQNKKTWCDFVRKRYYRNGTIINYHRSSSICGGIKVGLLLVTLDVQWIIGRQSKISWWKNWLNGRSLESLIHMPLELKFTEYFTISQIIHDGCWAIRQSLKTLFPVVVKEINEVHISKDELVWDGSTIGMITIKAAYNYYRVKEQIILWKKALWRKFIPTKMSLFVWKMINIRIITTSKIFN